MERFSLVLNIIDETNLTHLKTNNLRECIKDFEMVKTWLIDIDRYTDNKNLIFKQNIEVQILCVNDVEKLFHEKISEVRENVVLSAVGYENCNDNDTEKSFFFKRFSYSVYNYYF